jgi:peroxiredoxin
MVLPTNLPVPADDGAAARLLGPTVPDVALAANDGRLVSLVGIRGHRVIVDAYPRTGRPPEEPLRRLRRAYLVTWRR